MGGKRMKYLARASDLIDSAPSGLAWFLGSATPSRIAHAEEVLGISFPLAYREFLEAYGHGGFGPFEFYGITPGPSDPGSDFLDAVGLTMLDRKSGLPREFVAVYNLGNGEDYVLDPTMGDDPPVYAWSPGIGADRSLMNQVYPSFSRFLLDMVEEALVME